MRSLHYTFEANTNLVDIAVYIAKASGNVSIGSASVERLQAKCCKLAELPGTIGRRRPELRPDIRSFPYPGNIFFFRYDEDMFEVVNTLHGSRDIEGYFREEHGLGRPKPLI